MRMNEKEIAKMYQEKKDFVENEMQAVINKIDFYAPKLEYIRKGYCEIVRVTYSNEHTFDINVTICSLSAIANIIIKRF